MERTEQTVTLSKREWMIIRIALVHEADTCRLRQRADLEAETMDVYHAVLGLTRPDSLVEGEKS